MVSDDLFLFSLLEAGFAFVARRFQPRAIAAMAVIVDARDDAARAFYETYGLQRFRDDPYRLFIAMMTVSTLLT